MAPRKKKEEETPRPLDPEEQYQFVCKGHMESIQRDVTLNSKILEEHTSEIRAMSKKVFNGFGDKISALEAKVDKDIEDSARNHAEIKHSLESLMKFIGVSLVTILVAMLGILGTVWVNTIRIEESAIPVEHIQGVERGETDAPNTFQSGG